MLSMCYQLVKKKGNRSCVVKAAFALAGVFITLKTFQICNGIKEFIELDNSVLFIE